jgi:hypothetical protein
MTGNPTSVKVEVFPAGHGDAIIFRCSGGDSSFNIVIDGRPRRAGGCPRNPSKHGERSS